MKDYDVIFIIGPTSSGKTNLSIEVARAIDGEIINGDAFQVYRKMNIGTGKITLQEQGDIPHHLFDIIDYQQSFDVSQYQSLARACIEDIKARGKVPIIVGGSNLYIDSIIYNYQFNDNPDYTKVKAKYDNMNIDTLKEIINKANIKLNHSDYNNHKRLAALAAKVELNLNISNKKEELIYQPLFIKIDIDRNLLYDKINHRVDKMISDGLIDEVKQFEPNYLSQQAIGYKEVHQYLDGNLDLDACIELIKKKTRNYAKRQQTWINKYPAEIVVKQEGNIWKKIN